MSTAPMTTAQQSSSLAKDHAVRLAPAGHKRWLQVLEGQVWLTVTALAGQASDDQTLAAGDSVALNAFDDAVVEGLSAARFQLVEPALEFSSQASWRGGHSALASLHGWAQRLSLTAAPSVCV